MGKIIVIGSQKGGVGKTTTTLNLAYSLREMGKKVLTVDFDSQANLTILLIFFIKLSFIPIASNQDIWHPVWRPTHDIADGFVINILATFDDKLIMDMTADETVGEVTHGNCKMIVTLSARDKISEN